MTEHGVHAVQLVPAAQALDLVGGAGLLLQQALGVGARVPKCGAGGGVARDRVVPRAEALHHGLLGRERAVELWYLVEVFDASAAAPRDVAGVGRFDTGQQLTERALAGAVEPDDAHPLSRFDHEVSRA